MDCHRMLMPKGATWAATASQDPSMPHLVAWYIDEPSDWAITRTPRPVERPELDELLRAALLA